MAIPVEGGDLMPKISAFQTQPEPLPGVEYRPKRGAGGTSRPGELEIDGRRIMLGCSRIRRPFGGFDSFIAAPACQRLCVRRGATAFMSFRSFSAPPHQDYVKTGINSREAVLVDYMAMLPGMMVSSTVENGTYSVTAYAQSEEAASAFLDELDREMCESNFYKGKCLHFSREGIEFRPTPSVAWSDVILAPTLKREIMLNTIGFFRAADLHARGFLKRGLILHGPPGTGKTTVVRALFTELEGSGITRLYLTSDLFASLSMDAFFAAVRYIQPALLVFEDLDLVGPQRQMNRFGATGALLSHLDGIDKTTSPIVVIGTTNDFESVDEALRNRPARFDRILEVPLPTPPEIKEFYRRLIGVDADQSIISSSEGFTGAHIAEVGRTASMMAAEAGKKEAAPFVGQAIETVRRSFGAPGPRGFAQRRRPADEFAEYGSIALPPQTGGFPFGTPETPGYAPNSGDDPLSPA